MIYHYHNSTDMYKVMKDFISQLETISEQETFILRWEIEKQIEITFCVYMMLRKDKPNFRLITDKNKSTD